jgi:hypothetical protein
MEITHELLHLDKQSLVQLKIMDIQVLFDFFKRPFEYGNGGILKVLRWMQNLHQSTWDHAIFHADIF